MINLKDPEYKKKLEEVINKLNPDSDEYWKEHTVEKIKGVSYNIKDGIKIRRVDQEKLGLPKGNNTYATNKEIYKKLKEDGYIIIGFHSSTFIPIMFKKYADEGHYDWFAPPVEEDKRKT